MSKHGRGGGDSGRPQGPDTWVAPPKEERLAAKRAANQAPIVELTLDQQLEVATMDPSLEQVDLHGMQREDVAFELDQLLAQNRGQIVRIIYGHGTGVIAGEVMNYLSNHSRGKGATIEGRPKEDPRRASCVVKVK